MGVKQNRLLPLPALLRIFLDVDVLTLIRLRFACKKFNTIIKKYHVYLAQYRNECCQVCPNPDLIISLSNDKVSFLLFGFAQSDEQLWEKAVEADGELLAEGMQILVSRWISHDNKHMVSFRHTDRKATYEDFKEDAAALLNLLSFHHAPANIGANAPSEQLLELALCLPRSIEFLWEEHHRNEMKGYWKEKEFTEFVLKFPRLRSISLANQEMVSAEFFKLSLIRGLHYFVHDYKDDDDSRIGQEDTSLTDELLVAVHWDDCQIWPISRVTTKGIHHILQEWTEKRRELMNWEVAIDYDCWKDNWEGIWKELKGDIEHTKGKKALIITRPVDGEKLFVEMKVNHEWSTVDVRIEQLQLHQERDVRRMARAVARVEAFAPNNE